MRALTLMTWNVRYFGHGLRGLRATATWTRRLADAVSALPALPDLIALQEVETSSLRAGLDETPQLTRFQHALNQAVRARGASRRYEALYFPAHRYALRTGPALYTTGLAVLVADDLTVTSHNAATPYAITHTSPSPFARLKQTRVVAHVRLSGRETSLDLFNTHLSLPAFFEVGPHRVPARMGHGTNQIAEVTKLLAFIDAHRTATHAVVLGDFNTAPASPAYEALVAGGLVDAHAAFTGRPPRNLGHIGTARFLHLRMHLDHVFGTPNVRWRQFTAHRVDKGPFEGLSDHSPKVGQLTLD